jgi:putative PEP-CTERM system TPR-repeat lipoprotein
MATAALLVAGCSDDPATKARQFVASGDEYSARKNRDEAIIQYRNAIKVQPQWAEPHYKLAQAYEAGADYVNAYAEYARTADLEPSNLDAQIKAGTLLLVAGEFDAARTRAELALKADPTHAPAHILLGNAHAGLNELSSALRQIEQAISLEPSYAPAWTALGGVKFLRGRRDDAAAAFRKSVELAPTSVDARLALANFHWATGDVNQAEQTLRTALSLDASNPSAHRALALLYLTTKRAPAAEPHFRALAAQPKGKLALADYYMGLGRTPEALAVIGELEKSRDMTEVRAAKLRRASLAYGTGKKSEAHQIIDQLLLDKPRDAEARVAKAHMLIADGAMSEALKQAKEAVKVDATLPAAHYTLGLAALGDGKADEAEKAFEEVTRLTPRAAAAHLQLSRLKLARGEPTGALTAAQEAARERPDSPEAAILVSRSLRAQGDAARAWSELSTRAERYPESAPIQVEMGWVALERRQFPAARKAFAAAISLAPSSMDARSGLVATEIASGNPDAARRHVSTWSRSAPDDRRLHVLAARIEAAAGKPEQAERILQKVVAEDASHLDAYELLGRLYFSQNRIDRAIEQYEALGQHSPRPTGPRTMAAMLHEARGDRVRARQSYEAIVAADARAGIAANNLAWIYAEDGKLDEALRLARIAQEQLRRRPEGEDTLGWVHLKKGQISEAIAAFNRAIERAPSNAIYHYHLGLAYLQSGDTQRGSEELKRALSLNSEFTGADDARRRLAQVSGT